MDTEILAQPAQSPKPTLIPSIVPPNGSTPKSLELSATLSSALYQLNKEIVYVRATSEIAELYPPAGETRLKFMSPHDFKCADYCDRFIDVNDGNGKKKRIYLASEWMKWPQRHKVNRTVYEPGQPRITKDGNLNTWFRSLNIPAEGDVSPWLEYLDHLFASDATHRDWFIRWIAYPIQNPGTKLHTACVFWSSQTGTGKSTLAYILKEIYGQHNCSLLREADFTASYNGWAVGKVFVEVDEMPGGSRARQRAEILKYYTTRHTIPVDLKYQNRYEIRDTINYYYTSNHLESLYLDPNDRRFFIHNVGSNKLPEEFFRRKLDPWLKAGGFSAIHHWLLKVDLLKPIVGGDPYSSEPAPFSPGAAAPLSKSRQDVIEAGYDDVEAWIKELLECPESILGPDDHRTLFTSKELYAIFCAQYPSVRIGSTVMTRRLNEMGTQVNGGVQIRLGDCLKLRLHSIVKVETNEDVECLKSRWSQERKQS